MVLAAVAAAWFFVGAPLTAKLDIQKAFAPVLLGDLVEGIEGLKDLRARVPEKYHERIDLLISQAEAEAIKNRPESDEVSSPTLLMQIANIRTETSAMIFELVVENLGSAPLTLKNDYFYLRGAADIIQVAPKHTANTLDGVVVSPNEKVEGVVAFRKMPLQPVVVSVGSGIEHYYFVIFNDGKDYVKENTAWVLAGGRGF